MHVKIRIQNQEFRDTTDDWLFAPVKMFPKPEEWEHLLKNNKESEQVLLCKAKLMKNPIIQTLFKHRMKLVAGAKVSEKERVNHKAFIEQVAKRMVPRLAYTIAEDENNIQDHERERAEWLAYNMVLDICEPEVKEYHANQKSS